MGLEDAKEEGYGSFYLTGLRNGACAVLRKKRADAPGTRTGYSPTRPSPTLLQPQYPLYDNGKRIERLDQA